MNKKIKVIELFDIIAKGIDIPIKVEYKQKIYKFDSDVMDYVSPVDDTCLSLIVIGADNFKESLNNEVEILEGEEEIEELDKDGTFRNNQISHQSFIDVQNKINEIIKKVNELDKKIN